jgi:hypothetical protein
MGELRATGLERKLNLKPQMTPMAQMKKSEEGRGLLECLDHQ